MDNFKATYSFAILPWNTTGDLPSLFPAVERAVCLKAWAKAGAGLAWGVNIASSRHKGLTRCVLSFSGQ